MIFENKGLNYLIKCKYSDITMRSLLNTAGFCQSYVFFIIDYHKLMIFFKNLLFNFKNKLYFCKHDYAHGYVCSSSSSSAILDNEQAYPRAFFIFNLSQNE